MSISGAEEFPLSKLWTSHASGLTLIVLFASVTINALQARKIQDLSEPDVSVRSRVGQMAEPVTGVTPEGLPKTVRFAGGLPTVVYFFSPSCDWCKRNWANVSTLAHASAGRFRFVGVTEATGLRAFAQDQGLDFELLGGISSASRRALGLVATPHTVVVSSEGRISQEWDGAFEPRRERSVEDFFGIELPGLQPEGPTRVPRR